MDATDATATEQFLLVSCMEVQKSVRKILWDKMHRLEFVLAVITKAVSNLNLR